MNSNIPPMILGKIKIQNRIKNYYNIFLKEYDRPKLRNKHMGFISAEETIHGENLKECHWVIWAKSIWTKINHHYYHDQIKKLINYNVLDKAGHYSIMTIFNDVVKHVDEDYDYYERPWDNIKKKIYFMGVMIQGEGNLSFYKTKTSRKKIYDLHLERGDVVLFDPNTYHAFKSTSDKMVYMYHNQVTDVNIKI